MPRATQPERQRQDPWTCPPLRELPSTILVGCGQPGLKREGHLEDPGTPCSVNSGREGAPEDQGLRRLWLDGRWQAWGLMASSGHLLLFLFQPLTQRASEALCLGPHVALLLSRKQLRFARALTNTPPPCTMSKAAARNWVKQPRVSNSPSSACHSPGPWLVGALCNREKSLGSLCLGPRLPTPRGKAGRGNEPLVSWVPWDHPVQRS